MSDNAAKTLATTAIWIATALIFVLGVFRVKINGDGPIFFWFIISVVLAAAPALATAKIWSTPAIPGKPPTQGLL